MPKTLHKPSSPRPREVYFGAVNETFSNASTAVDTGDWTSIGVVQDDPTLGLDIEKAVIRASNVTGPVREPLFGRTFSWQLDQAQWTKKSIENYFGGGTWATSGSGEMWTAGSLASVEAAMLWVGIDQGTGLQIRIGHKRVSITPAGDIAFGTEDLIKLPVNVTALAPDTGADIYIWASTALSAA